MRRWDVLVVVLLTYTATITPFEVAFLETKLNGWFVIARFVDICFVIDMVLQFFLW